MPVTLLGRSWETVHNEEGGRLSEGQAKNDVVSCSAHPARTFKAGWDENRAPLEMEGDSHTDSSTTR